MSDVAAYEKTKDSGIEWIGNIPSHWRVHTLYQLVTQVKEKNSNLQEKNLLSLSYGKIKRKDIDSPDGLLPASFDGYNILKTGDIVLRLTDLQNDHTSLRVGVATERGIITSAYTTLRPIDGKTSKYLYYLIHAFDLKKGFYGMGSGVRQGLNYGEVKELRVVLPNQDEQDAIVRFLDNQCAQVDAVIAEAKASVDEYKSWKDSIIFEAVTKGMNSSAEMKDSRVDWIGKTPKHWSLLSLKYLCTMQAGKNLVSEQIEEYGKYPVYGGNGIRGYFSSYNNEGEYLLIGRQGALCGNVHSVTGRFWATEHAVVTKNTEAVSLTFLYYLLNGMKLNQYASNSAAQPGLSVGTISNIKTVLPPMDEQSEIGVHLDKKCSMIDTLICEKEALLGELEAYKRSLIFETVTGKRKVV